jgi:hypothetical protein
MADVQDPGQSVTRSAEDIDEDEAGREATGTTGASDRPKGESTARDRTGVDPQETVTDTPMH